MEQRRNTVGSIVHKPLLQLGHTVTQIIGITRLLQSELREMPYSIRYQFTALNRIQFALSVKEHVHIHTLELRNTLLLRHSVIQAVYLFLQIISVVTSCQRDNST